MIIRICVGTVIALLIACESYIEPKSKQDATLSTRFISNIPLGLPGDPTSIFDIAIFEHSSDPNPTVAIQKDFARGGFLYDTWWALVDGSQGTAPAETATTNLMWPTDVNPNQTGEATWKCHECHGWDYLGAAGIYGDTTNVHYSGIKGVISTADATLPALNDPALIFDFIHSGLAGNGASHEFGLWIGDADVYALTRFIYTVQQQLNDTTRSISPSKIIDPTTNIITADSSAGFTAYHALVDAGGCDESCHGVDGTLISTGAFDMTTMSNRLLTDPWKALHTIRFGQPGSQPFMQGLSAIIPLRSEFNVAADIVAYGQHGLARDHVRGGRLFDNWMKETLTPPPATFNHLWDQRDPAFDAPVTIEASWTCADCHDWDYSGYIGFENDLHFIADVAGWTPDVVFTALKEGFNVRQWPDNIVLKAHNYGLYLSDAELWNIVAFLTEDLINPYKYITSTWSSRGIYDLGKAIYDGGAGVGGDCITCHGVDGQGGGVATNPIHDIFALSWDSPFEFFHKVRFGAAGSTMIGLLQRQKADGSSFTLEDTANVHEYAQLRLDPSTPP